MLATGQSVPDFLKMFWCGHLYVRVCVCVHVHACMCPPTTLLITSGVMWNDMDPKLLVK